MGTEPKEDEVPLELQDLPDEVALAYVVYDYLPARWDTFSGVFLGKDIGLAPTYIKLLDLPDPKLLIRILMMIDPLERDEVNKRRKNGSSDKAN